MDVGTNVLIILLDDVGFGASSTFGGPCRTPTADRLAADGLRYNRFHTTALCLRRRDDRSSVDQQRVRSSRTQWTSALVRQSRRSPRLQCARVVDELIKGLTLWLRRADGIRRRGRR
jgi:hypothetical protein